MMKTNGFKRNIIKYGFLTLFTVGILYPLFVAVISSFRNNTDIMMNVFGWPNHPMFNNYSKAWVEGWLYAFFHNSLIVTSFSVVLIIIMSSMVAFVLTREDFKLKVLIYFLILAGITVPYQVGVIPLYLQMARMKLIDNHVGLIIIYIAYGLPFSVFIMEGFFKHISKEIQEAAVVDGCGNFRLYFNIIMPLSPAVVTTVTIFNLMWIWNDFFYPLVFIKTKLLKTLPIGLFSFKGQYLSDYATMFAGTVIVSLPMIILFLLLQRRFIEGVAQGAVKG